MIERARMVVLAVVMAVAGQVGAADRPATVPEKDWPEPAQTVRLWDGNAPGWVPSTNREGIVNQRIRNVSVPELWSYPPDRPGSNRTAIVICPGGGYSHLAVGLHVANVLELFHARDVVVFALKYRTRYGTNDAPADAVADAARALRIVRQHAAEWGIDPARIGIQGYSAGGNVCVNLLGRYDGGDPAAADPAARMASRPDFVALMCAWPNGKPASAYPVGANPPPVFVATAEDDRTAPTAFSMEVAGAVKKQGGAVELFIVPTGGHSAFHVGRSTGPGVAWPAPFLAWLEKLHLLNPTTAPSARPAADRPKGP